MIVMSKMSKMRLMMMMELEIKGIKIRASRIMKQILKTIETIKIKKRIIVLIK